MPMPVPMPIPEPGPRLSFEFFPPADDTAAMRLWNTVDDLAPLGPKFVSVTHGAGGTVRASTLKTAKGIQTRHGLNVTAHLTCVGASRDRIMAKAWQLSEAGVNEILALRGDPPGDKTEFHPHSSGFRNTCELVSALKDVPGIRVRVSAYPDPHPDAAYVGADVDWLKRKLDAGAESAITQFFFEAETYFRFRDACQRAGIDAPIIPGILPIQNWVTVRKFARRCGAHVPDWLDSAFRTALRDGDGRHDLLAISVCTELCSELIAGGVEQLHFYTLNRSRLTRKVIHALGLSPVGKPMSDTGKAKLSTGPSAGMAVSGAWVPPSPAKSRKGQSLASVS